MKFIIPALLAAILLITGCGSVATETPNKPAVAKATPDTVETPEPTPVEPVATPEPVETITGNKSFLKAVGRGDAEGSNVNRLVGKAFNVDQEGDGIAVQMWLDDDADEQAIVYINDADFEISEDDYLSVSGTIGGDFEGETVMGAELTAATVQADTYKVVTAKAMHPTLSKSSKQHVSIGNVQYTVHAEYAADQTRFVVKAVNYGGESEYIESDPNVVSNGNQKDSEYDDSYGSLEMELSPGATTKGTIVYKKLKKGSIEMHFEGHDADYNTITQTLYF